MRRHGRFFFLGSLLASATLLSGCNANEGGEGALESFFGLQAGFGSIPLPEDALTFCCEEEGEGIAMLVVEGPLAPVGSDFGPYQHPSQFDGNPDTEDVAVPAVRYLGFSLKDVAPADALEFRWNGGFVGEDPSVNYLNRNENDDGDLLPFDPDLDVGEPPGRLEVSARRCDFDRATFTMVVFEFAYLADVDGILVYRTQERTVEIVNTCYTPPPPPPPASTDLIVFSNTPDGGYSDIYSIDPSAGVGTQLTDNGNVSDDDPAWSPDRSRIAFVSSRVDPAHVNLDVVVMNADGSNPQPLTDFTAMATVPPFAPAKSAFGPAWSPDGTKIAVSAGRTGFGQEDIWVIDLANGNQLTRLTQTGSGDRSPTWSPGGTEIAFARSGLVYKVAADGMSAPVQVALPTAEFVDSPDWGAAGFAVEMYLVLSHDYKIWHLDPFSAPPESASLTSGTPDRVPSWSPDSRFVAFVREGAEGGPSEKRLWTVPVGNSSAAAEVSGQPAGENYNPDWGFPLLP